MRCAILLCFVCVTRAQISGGPMRQPLQPQGPQGPAGFAPVLPRQRPLTIADRIIQDPTLSQMANFLQRVDLLKTLNTTTFVSTVFIPNNEAFSMIEIPTDTIELLKLVEYHYVAGNITSEKMLSNGHKWTLNGTYFNGSSVWFDTQRTANGVTKYYVNGALIVVPDNTAANGVYHVIDRVLQPLGSVKSVVEYIETVPTYSLVTSLIQDQRSLEIRNALKNDSRVWTVFAPIDDIVPVSYLSELDPVQALSHHVVPDRVLFDRILTDQTNVQALTGNIEITRENDKVFVRNGEGERAEIVALNQPTENGVIHRISDVLGLSWRGTFQSLSLHESVNQFKRQIVSAKMAALLDDRNRTFSVFAPTNEALDRFLLGKHITRELSRKLVNCHVSDQKVTSMDVEYRGVSIQTLSAGDILISKDSPQSHMVARYDDHRVKILIPDLNTANGVLHIIDGVFGNCVNRAPSVTISLSVTTFMMWVAFGVKLCV